MKLKETLAMRQAWALEGMKNLATDVEISGWNDTTMTSLRMLNDSISTIIAIDHLIACNTD